MLSTDRKGCWKIRIDLANFLLTNSNSVDLPYIITIADSCLFSRQCVFSYFFFNPREIKKNQVSCEAVTHLVKNEEIAWLFCGRFFFEARSELERRCSRFSPPGIWDDDASAPVEGRSRSALEVLAPDPFLPWRITRGVCKSPGGSLRDR